MVASYGWDPASEETPIVAAGDVPTGSQLFTSAGSLGDFCVAQDGVTLRVYKVRRLAGAAQFNEVASVADASSILSCIGIEGELWISVNDLPALAYRWNGVTLTPETVDASFNFIFGTDGADIYAQAASQDKQYRKRVAGSWSVLTAPGGSVVAPLTPPSAGGIPYNGACYFPGSRSTGGPTNIALVKIAGTTVTYVDSSVALNALPTLTSSSPVVFNGKLYWIARDSSAPSSLKLYKYDGATITAEFDFKNSSLGTVYPRFLVSYDGSLYTLADSGLGTTVLLKSLGTTTTSWSATAEEAGVLVGNQTMMLVVV